MAIAQTQDTEHAGAPPTSPRYTGGEKKTPAPLDDVEELESSYDNRYTGPDPRGGASNQQLQRGVSTRSNLDNRYSSAYGGYGETKDGGFMETRDGNYMETKDGNPQFPEPNTQTYPFTQKYAAGPQDSDTSFNALNANQPTRTSRYQDLEYADPLAKGTSNTKTGPLGRFFNQAKYPIEQRIENKKRGIGVQRHPFVVWIVSAAIIGVFIWELILNQREQGSPISTKPVFNPMLGPSGSALIFLGARFPPCMKTVQDVPLTLPIACMNNTANPITSICTVGDLCSFGGIPQGQEPNQWFRFIIPIFLHAGVIHLLLNLFAQLSLSAHIEREMGSGGFFMVYFSAGIFGNVLGGNFSLVGVPSVGASGAIFGTLAVTWVDLVAHWRYHYRPVRKLIFMTIELAIGVAVGFIPYVDNFAHLGGFLMGLLVGTIFYPVISTTRRHKIIMWGFRLIAIPFIIVLFVLLVKNFYTSDPYAACSGCRYLSCIPSAANNQCKGTGLTTTTTNLRRHWPVEL